MRPRPHVLKAFGLSGEVVPTHTNEVWRADSAALKCVDHPEAVEWLSSLLATRHEAHGYRVAVPIAARDGTWIVDGWSCSEWCAGEADGSRWQQIITAGDAFHDWLAGVERPDWVDRVNDPWRQSDRVAWGEQPTEAPGRFASIIDELASMRRPVSVKSQLIHGDLTGNVLFSESEPPAIIDLSLYWRPPGYAAAIVAVDGYEWEGVGPEVFDYVTDLPDGEQLLVRAALFRVIRAAMVDWANPEARLEAHRRTAAWMRTRIE